VPPSLLAPVHTVLLVIDLQLGMFDGVRIAPIHAGEALLTRVQILLTKARAAGTPVIYVRHSARPGRPLDPTTPQWDIHPAIAPLPTETIVDKRTPDAFLDTTLLDTLTASGTKRLIVVGAQTELCVDTTCRRAFALGFDVVLVADGHSTWDNDVLTAEQIIPHTNQTLAEWFVRTVATAEL
jgi:nicotinamidase-related amidase